MPILALQRRQRPRRTSQLTTGTRSSGPSSSPQLPHAEPGVTIDLPCGTRSTTTVRNDPMTRPRIVVNATTMCPFHGRGGRPRTEVSQMLEPDPGLVALLQATVSAGASDLHLSVGRPATARRDGYLVKFEGVPIIEPSDTERIVMSLLDDRLKAELHEANQVDFSFGIAGIGRFRANAYSQRGSLALALR